MADSTPFAQLVPGFDFLQDLVKNAGSTLPHMGQWVAPTLNPEELEKRISELKTVQFWLEQNARMLGATIQALEVQRMTLSTLKTMNVQMEDLRDSLTIKMPQAVDSSPSASGFAASPTSAAPAAESPAPANVPGDHRPAGQGPAVDPMQWWGALTQQFTQLATDALEKGAQASKTMAATQPGVAGATPAATANEPSSTKPPGKPVVKETGKLQPGAKAAGRKKSGGAAKR